MMQRLFVILLCATSTLLGCTGTASKARMALAPDHSRISPMRAAEVMALGICDHYQRCKGFDANTAYADYDICVRDELARWRGIWPEQACTGPREPLVGKVRECRERIKLLQCSSSVFDFGGVATQCGAGQVCR